MKGSNTVVDVYSWLAIFHGQCTTALFNTPLPATLGFLFNSSTFIFSGVYVQGARPVPQPLCSTQHPQHTTGAHTPPPQQEWLFPVQGQ